MRWLRLCRTVRSPRRPMRVMVHRSPFFTQSVAVRRSRRSLARVMITSPTLARFPSAKGTSAVAGGVIETMRPGTAVELGDQVPGGGDHDRVEPSRSIGNPSVERILSRGGQVADMNTAVIKVEVECLWFAFSEGERCCRFGGVGEAVQLGQAEGAVGVL